MIVIPCVVIAVAITGVIVMKRIYPDDYFYPIYASVIVLLFLIITYLWF